MPDTARHDALPAYLRIAEMLARDIAVGRLADGARLPPERDLAPDLEVSVGTLRKALAELEARGLLQRRHGSGNYVRREPRAAAGYAMFRLELPGGGGQPSSELLSAERLPKPQLLADLGPAPHAFRLRRLRYLNGQDVALEEIWIDGRFGEALPQTGLETSLYRTYQSAFALWVLSAKDRIDQDAVPDWAPGHFSLPPSAPCLRVRRTGYDQYGLAAEMSWNYVNSARAQYVAPVP